jgi:hypothetical protein
VGKAIGVEFILACRRHIADSPVEGSHSSVVNHIPTLFLLFSSFMSSSFLSSPSVLHFYLLFFYVIMVMRAFCVNSRIFKNYPATRPLCARTLLNQLRGPRVAVLGWGWVRML